MVGQTNHHGSDRLLLSPTVYSSMRYLLSLILASGLLHAESFETAPNGPIKELKSEFGTWQPATGALNIHQGNASDGKKSLQILNSARGTASLLELSQTVKVPTQLRFRAERWTRTAPFSFTISAAVRGKKVEIFNGSKSIAVGGFGDFFKVSLPKGTTELHFHCESPAKTGVLLDEFTISPEKPMNLVKSVGIQPVIPAMKRMEINPVLGLTLLTEGNLKALELGAIGAQLKGSLPLDQIESVQLLPGPADGSGSFGNAFGKATKPDAKGNVVFQDSLPLKEGDNTFWLSIKLKETASIDHKIDAEWKWLKTNNKTQKITTPDPEGSQRIGVAVRKPGDDGSKSYRIPGIVSSNKGTLIATYDIRYDGARDLPANIDVGINRSEDGGQTWGPMIVAMDMGDSDKFNGNGIGDPTIFVDRETGRIWLAALWSKGNRAWHGSGAGMTPDETGQFMLVYSDDDGKSWSKPINITEQVKDPKWKLLFNGPGAGITMRDGTLVCPAQFRDAEGMPFSTLIWSKDHGKTWDIGTGVKSNTTEAQVVELADGSLMINCRDNRGGSRTIATTKDLGKTWQLHSTDRSALQEPICMASILAWSGKDKNRTLLFSNPNTRSGRRLMTVKASLDQGMTWPEKHHLLYDSRPCFGYSSLARIDEQHLGVFYEGRGQMFFLKLPIDEIVRQ